MSGTLGIVHAVVSKSADALKLRIVCVFYHVVPGDFGPSEGGLGPIDGLNVVDINSVSTYLKALAKRVKLP